VLDDARDVGNLFDPERHLVDLSAYRFDRSVLDFVVTVSNDTIAAVFAPGERSQVPAQLVVVVQCARTRVRRGVLAAIAPLAAGEHRVAVELMRSDVIGGVELTPFLVRSAGRTDARDGYAVALGSRVASGRTIEVRFETIREPVGEFLDVRYESFRAKGPPQFPRVDAVYQLEAAGDHPILWLNLDHQHLCPILDDVANIGRMARTRDLLFDRIEYAVWTRLFLRAARDHVRTDGELPFAWQRPVLTKLLALVYPEVVDHESRLEALRRDFDESEDELLDRLDTGLQQERELGRIATALAEELA
jgi:hypothetical protein